MPLYDLVTDPALEAPVMILSLSGWVDAASVGTTAAGYLGEGGDIVAEFDRDALFDYRSSRPVLRFEDGNLEEVTWPRLTVVRASVGGLDLLTVTGSEPDFRWRALADDLSDLAIRFGVQMLVTLGAVPAAVPHTREPRVMTTASDPSLVGPSDEVLAGTLIVPGAAVSILRERIVEAGVPAVGYWAQVPHYLNTTWYAGAVALLRRVESRVGVALDLSDLEAQQAEQDGELERMLEERPEAKTYVDKLEVISDDASAQTAFERLGRLGEDQPLSPEELPTADELAAEVEKYLRGEL
jgi:proteasome assembly chaperone (PAC2) family protein